ncbi:DUF6270 domain-containing protein [Rothia sp. P7208]|uniref:DUF6270 domain-containing protein n=1 Tax=Rothia sp. P7208 TaxID=3402660 RepID=UPI003AD19D5B
MKLTSGEHLFQGQKHSLKYMFRQGSSDRKHLLVIFSGFRAKGTLDFSGAALSSIRHNVLWIYDEFGEDHQNSYYLMEHGTFSIRDTVDEFLNSVREELDLSWENIAYTGFSKGGTAALYFGLRHQVGAVISTVPQFFIGRYVRKNWPAVFEYMKKPSAKPQTAQKTIDAVMSDLLKKAVEVKTHLYVMTSPNDYQYEEEIKPYLSSLERFENFNLLVSESPLITQHNEVTAYNVPVLLALFQLVADGIFPTIGNCHTRTSASATLAARQRQRREGVAIAEKVTTTADKRLELSLVTLIRGVAQPDYTSMNRKLIVRSSTGDFTMPLGKRLDPSISRRYVQDTFVDYSAASSSTVQGAGISLSAFPLGRSTLHVSMMGKSASSPVEAPVTTRNPFFSHVVDGDQLLLWSSDSTQTTVSKIYISKMVHDQYSFLKMDHCSISAQKKLHLRGWFAPLGTTISQWGDAHYYAHLEGANGHYSFPLGILDKGALCEDLGIPQSMSKAYLCDIRAEGIDLSGLVAGDYQVSVVCVNKDVSVRSTVIASVVVDVDASKDKPKVVVLGSCIVRDVFNSVFIQDWRNRNSLLGAAHQSALTSLASEPYQGKELTLADLDEHSKKCVVEDLSKKVIRDLGKEAPEYVIMDLFSDARFGVKDLGGTYITDNDWKINTSQEGRETFGNYPSIKILKQEEEYLALFKESLKTLWKKYNPGGQGSVVFVLVKVRATDKMRNKFGEVKHLSSIATDLNNAFEKLEKVFFETIPNAEVIDMTEHTAWANLDHRWSSYVVHYEQHFCDALDYKLRELMRSVRRVRVLNH